MTDDAWGMVEQVRSGEVSPAELVEGAINRIEKLDAEINAVIVERFDRARAEAASPDLPDGPLRGVPWVLKDLDAPMAGERYAGGIARVRRAGYVAPHDAVLVERLRAAGAVCVGKSNTPELGLLPTTEPRAWGPSRNPHDLTRSTGGSSGGSAAAVASGMVPVGHANDGGGSIRIPAAHCGLVGLKPTRGRVPQWPEGAEYWAGLVMQGVVTKTVRDTALVYDVLAGPATGDLHTPPDPAPPERPLRVGVLDHIPGDLMPTDPACRAAAEETGRRLEEAGHHVDEAHPPALHEETLTTNFLPCFASWTAADLDAWGARIGRLLGEDDVEPTTWAVAEMGRTVTAAQYLAHLAELHAYSRRVQSWWDEGWDLLVTPTLPEPPPPLGSFDPQPDNPLAGLFHAGYAITFTVPYNITGQPAISVPVHETEDGLPVGVQLVGRFGADRLLLRVAETLLPI